MYVYILSDVCITNRIPEFLCLTSHILRKTEEVERVQTWCCPGSSVICWPSHAGPQIQYVLTSNKSLENLNLHSENLYPIIMISSSPTALITMHNVKRFLQESMYVTLRPLNSFPELINYTVSSLRQRHASAPHLLVTLVQRMSSTSTGDEYRPPHPRNTPLLLVGKFNGILSLIAPMHCRNSVQTLGNVSSAS